MNYQFYLLQAVLSDLRSVSSDTSSGSGSVGVANVAAPAEHVIQWAYDLIVLDPSKGPFRKKVTGSLLDGILGLLESLMVFEAAPAPVSSASEVSGHQAADGQQAGWRERMAKMAFDILLKVAEQGRREPELCAMAAAKLHALVQTRTQAHQSSPDENAYLIFRYFYYLLPPDKSFAGRIVTFHTES